MIRWLSARFSRRLALAFGLTIAGAMSVTGLVLTRALRGLFTENLQAGLQTQASLIAAGLAPASFKTPGDPELDRAARLNGETARARVTFIRADGTVLADSRVSPEDLPRLENHAGRPEVRAALAGGLGTDLRRSATLHEGLLYAAAPFKAGGKILGVVRLAVSVDELARSLDSFGRLVRRVTLTMVALAVLAGLLLARTVSRPVEELSRAAERLALGDYQARVRLGAPDEHGRLGETLNVLAERVQEAIRDLTSEKAQVEAILGQMVEAVIAVDDSQRVLAVNAALARLFKLDPAACRGRPLLEVLRHPALEELLLSVLMDRQARAEEVRLAAPEEHVFQAHAGPLELGGGAGGALLVLHDITRLRRLEQVRKDFVANVSHELRTPLASIKAFAETLRGGALEDKKTGLEFVETIEKDADRMTRLVDDLLELSALESGRLTPSLEPLSLMEIAREAAESLRPLAEKRRVSLEVRDPGPLPKVLADRGQLRQVFNNLIDNAVKFNREGGAIVVAAESRGSIVSVSVKDTGPGIPSQDLPRIFERFYRVDKARSRELGGTGLGLAIVKHIIEGHGGSVSVDSRSGQGSTFSFTLPAT